MMRFPQIRDGERARFWIRPFYDWSRIHMGHHCPFCAAVEEDEEAVECDVCEVLHHESCYEVHGGCKVANCPFRKRPDELLWFCHYCGGRNITNYNKQFYYHKSCREQYLDEQRRAYEEKMQALNEEHKRAIRTLYIQAVIAFILWGALSVGLMFLVLS